MYLRFEIQFFEINLILLPSYEISFSWDVKELGMRSEAWENCSQNDVIEIVKMVMVDVEWTLWKILYFKWKLMECTFCSLKLDVICNITIIIIYILAFFFFSKFHHLYGSFNWCFITWVWIWIASWKKDFYYVSFLGVLLDEGYEALIGMIY